MRAGARRHPDDLAVLDDGVAWTYAELDGRMLRATRAFIAMGVAKGDRVALCGPNSPDWIVAALGLMGAGGVLVPVNTRFRGQELAHVLRHSGASIFVTVGSLLGHDYVEMVAEADPTLLRPDRTVTLPGAGTANAVGWDRFEALGEQVATPTAVERVEAIGPTDLSDILFTSGTTGQPKGVIGRHGKTMQGFGDMGDLMTVRPGDRFLVVPPFFHSAGYRCGWLLTFMHGATVVPQGMFEVADVLARIERLRISVMVGPPTLFNDLINHPARGGHDLSSLRVCCASASVVPVETITRLRDVLGFDVVLNAYGSTETPAVTSSRVDDDPADIATTVGRLVDGVEVKIVDDTGSEVGVGGTGEITVRGPCVTEGYWQDPAATAAAFDADGFFRTGDIGVFDARGYLRITDRKKDMFIVGGFNAYPAEIERLLAMHESVESVAVIGVPDVRMGEVGVAFVVLRPGAEADADALTAWARERMANYKVPRQVRFVGEIPRNASLKVSKDVLRTMAAAGPPS